MNLKANKSKLLIYMRKRAPWVAIFYLSLVGVCILFADLLPLPFLPVQLDLNNICLPPFQWQSYIEDKSFHWLGTDALGRDVLANIIYGARTAFLVSVPAVCIASGLGLLLGGIAGFYGDKAMKLSFTGLFILLTFLLLAYFYGFYLQQNSFAGTKSGNNVSSALFLNWLTFITILAIGIIVSKWVDNHIKFSTYLYIPIDQIIMKCIELLSSIPRIILILCLAAYTRPSLLNLILITGFTYWTEPARLIRAELLRIKTLNYIESARAMGMADFYILIRHALPNSLPSIIVASTFGIAGLISLESTLSFLNIGMPADIASWGKMVAGVRNNCSAWWLVLFPGLALCGTVLALQTISNWIIQKLNPKNR